MKSPKILNCPLWYGKIRRRVAKKHLPKCFRDKFWVASLANLKEGDMINDCSGYNVKIFKIEPIYKRVGKNGQVLVDIDITVNEWGGSCSLRSCGIIPALSREMIVQRMKKFIDRQKESGDDWNFAKRWEFTTLDENGIATINFQGIKDKYGI